MKSSRKHYNFWTKALVFLISAVFLLSGGGFAPTQTQAASSSILFLTPSTGTFVVGSTFDVSVFLDTQGQSVNTIDLALKFPPDKLQLVSSGTGKSIIGLWTSQPKYNNQTGTLELTGGVPGGVNVSRGLITSLTFRVKAVGNAVVKFDRTRVLLNDGAGTEALTQTQNSVYDLILPAPAGPVVVSETHPDQTKWYQDNSAILRWGDDQGADGYSYMISDLAIDTPDEISEGNKREVIYQKLGDGHRYFHIRALRDGRWGGTTHFAVNIDATAPADFKIDVVPNARTNRVRPVFQFTTTDSQSGLDHYELKIVPLKPKQKSEDGQTTQDRDVEIFIEAQSPYVPSELEYGNYDVIVRAFDKSGNYREVVQRVEIVPTLLRYVGSRGFEIKSTLIISWWLVWLFLLLIIVALGYLAYRAHIWHRFIHRQKADSVLPTSMQVQMEELQKYRSKYGKIAILALVFSAAVMFMGTSTAKAQEDAMNEKVVNVPVITTLSKNITNEEIFYAGGKTGRSNSEVILYIQNSQTTETISETIKADKNGDWFYRHDSFLTAGNYVLWAQGRIDNQMSPPSPEVQITVEETAIQFGATRVSYATLYLISLIGALLILAVLMAYLIYHAMQGRKKHQLMLKEISEAQESLRRGFAVLNRDIQAELGVIKQAKLSQKLSAEQKEKEQQLLKDLSDIEQYMSKEIWDIENAEHVTR